MRNYTPFTLKQLVVLLMCCVFVAFIASEARADWKPDKVVVNKNDIDKSITNRNTMDQDQHQRQAQGQSQHQSSEASASASASNAGNNQAVTFTSPDDITLRNTASANAPSVYPSGNCYGGWSAGLGLPGVNLSGGKAVLDHQCDMRETARMFAAVGERELAVMLLCQTEAASYLPECGPTRQFVEDYKALKAQNELLHDDVNKTVERLERVCSDSVTKGFEACQAGK
jgi:hypothetical protein